VLRRVSPADVFRSFCGVPFIARTRYIFIHQILLQVPPMAARARAREAEVGAVCMLWISGYLFATPCRKPVVCAHLDAFALISSSSLQATAVIQVRSRVNCCRRTCTDKRKWACLALMLCSLCLLSPSSSIGNQLRRNAENVKAHDTTAALVRVSPESENKAGGHALVYVPEAILPGISMSPCGRMAFLDLGSG